MKKFFFLFYISFGFTFSLFSLEPLNSKENKKERVWTKLQCPKCTETSPLYLDQIPENISNKAEDKYLTGYVQALLDMHYYEFCVKAVVSSNIAYVSGLPLNLQLEESIIRFIRDIPFIKDVVKIKPIKKVKKDNCCSSRKSYRSFLDGVFNVCYLNAIWFPQNTVVFSPFISDPRQITNGAALRFNDDVIGQHVGSVSFGGDFVLLRLLNLWKWHGDLDIGIQAGIFSVFDLDHIESCMVNTDFFVSAMFAYAIDKWSWRLRLWHLSSHLGDEYILTHPTFPRFNLSDEGLDLFASYYFRRSIRLYLGLGYIFSRDETFPEDPLYIEGGVEIKPFGVKDKAYRLYKQPFLAMHFRLWEEHDFNIDQTYALGMEWSRFQDVGRKSRIFFEYHQGFSKEGQFIREKVNYYSIKTTYGF